jgi:hypothetical protein
MSFASFATPRSWRRFAPAPVWEGRGQCEQLRVSYRLSGIAKQTQWLTGVKQLNG